MWAVPRRPAVDAPGRLPRSPPAGGGGPALRPPPNLLLFFPSRRRASTPGCGKSGWRHHLYNCRHQTGRACPLQIYAASRWKAVASQKGARQPPPLEKTSFQYPLPMPTQPFFLVVCTAWGVGERTGAKRPHHCWRLHALTLGRLSGSLAGELEQGGRRAPGSDRRVASNVGCGGPVAAAAVHAHMVSVCSLFFSRFCYALLMLKLVL